MNAEPQLFAEGRPRRRDGNAEARIQAEIVVWCREHAPQVLIFAVPNGGLRSKREAARLKWTGEVAGIFDLCVIAPGGKAHFIEVKRPGAYLSADQLAMCCRLLTIGSPHIVARSVEDVQRAFVEWGIRVNGNIL